MTALAAVIALSSTPLFAQSADEPIVTTAPAIEVTPAPIVVEPVATTPTADTTAADPLAATATTKPAARKASTVKSAAKARPTAARAASVAPAVAAAPSIAAPAAEIPAEAMLPIEPEIAAPPVAAAPSAATNDTTMNEMLPVAGAGGLALVLLAGTGLAIRRRRRRAQEAEDAAWQQDLETAADPIAEPAMIEQPAPAMPAPAMMAEQQPPLELSQPAFVAAAAPVPETASGLTPIDAPTTDLPDGFDLSRFGFNVQQAYKGPTEDNPSLSLKHRLRRASGMDQQERKLEAEVEAVTGESPLDGADEPAPIAETLANPAGVTSTKGDFLFGRDGSMPAFRPARTQ